MTTAPSLKPNSYAVYPSQGVVKVVGIEERTTNNSTDRFYKLEVVRNGSHILVPAHRAAQSNLRALSTREDVTAAIAAIRARLDVRVSSKAWNRKFKEYQDKIRNGLLVGIAEVYADLMRVKSQKELSYGERKLLETSEELLSHEISIVSKTSLEDVCANLRSAASGTK